MRRILYLIFLGLLGWFIWRNIGDIKIAIVSASSGNIFWLTIGLIFMGARIFFNAKMYQSMVKRFEYRVTNKDIIVKTLISNTVNVLVPSGVGGSVALMAEIEPERSHRIKLTIAGLIVQFIDIVVFACILILGMLCMMISGGVGLAVATAASVLAVGLFVFLIIIAWGMWSPERSAAMIKRFTSLIKRSPDSDTNLLAGITQVKAVLTNDQFGNTRIGLYALATHLCQIAILWLSAISFGVHLTLTQMLITYSIATLFMIMSVTPQGVGIVEGALTASLIGIGIDAPVAILVAITYRLLVFWLPLMAGGVLMARKNFHYWRHSCNT